MSKANPSGFPVRTLKNLWRGLFYPFYGGIPGVPKRHQHERFEQKDGPGIVYGGKRSWSWGKSDPLHHNNSNYLEYRGLDWSNDYWGYLRAQLENSQDATHRKRYHYLREFLDKTESGQPAVKLLMITDGPKGPATPPRAPMKTGRRVMCPLYVGDIDAWVKPQTKSTTDSAATTPPTYQELKPVLEHVLNQLESAAQKTGRPYISFADMKSGTSHDGSSQPSPYQQDPGADHAAGELGSPHHAMEGRQGPGITYSLGSGAAKREGVSFPEHSSLIFTPGKTWNKGRGLVTTPEIVNAPYTEEITLNGLPEYVQRVLAKARLTQSPVEIDFEKGTATILSKEAIEREQDAAFRAYNGSAGLGASIAPNLHPAAGKPKPSEKELNERKLIKNLSLLKPETLYSTLAELEPEEKGRRLEQVREVNPIKFKQLHTMILKEFGTSFAPSATASPDEIAGADAKRHEAFEAFRANQNLKGAFEEQDAKLFTRLTEKPTKDKLYETMKLSAMEVLDALGKDPGAEAGSYTGYRQAGFALQGFRQHGPAEAGAQANAGALPHRQSPLHAAYVSVLYEEISKIPNWAAGDAAENAWQNARAAIAGYMGEDGIPAENATPPAPSPEQKAMVALDRIVNVHAPVVVAGNGNGVNNNNAAAAAMNIVVDPIFHHWQDFGLTGAQLHTHNAHRIREAAAADESQWQSISEHISELSKSSNPALQAAPLKQSLDTMKSAGNALGWTVDEEVKKARTKETKSKLVESLTESFGPQDAKVCMEAITRVPHVEQHHACLMSHINQNYRGDVVRSLNDGRSPLRGMGADVLATDLRKSETAQVLQAAKKDPHAVFEHAQEKDLVPLQDVPEDTQELLTECRLSAQTQTPAIAALGQGR